MEIVTIPCLQDNFAYLLICEKTGEAAVVDPSEAEPVRKEIKRQNVKLTAILNTHHHWDHVGGNKELKADYPDLKGNIQSFLLGHINMLHIRTAFQLVSSHNRDGAASIAGAVKAFENVILHLIDKHSIDSGVANFIFLERTNPA